jgi:adenylate kinase
MGDVAKYVILLGAPGAGKGTQADILQQRIGLVHISSGDLFRENISKQTDLGKLAKAYMDKGELVPDDVTVRMVLDRIGRPDCARGVVFDGFPRTEAQAKALSAALMEQGMKVNGAVLVNVRDQVLIERLSARWICPTDGAVYNMLSNPPRDNGHCDKDGSVLEQRNDDKPETVRRRLNVYHTQTKPLIDYYRAEGLLYEVDGERQIEQVQADLAKILEKL